MATEKTSEKAAKPPEVKVVFFDVGGTLIVGEYGWLDYLCEALTLVGYDLKREEVARANDLARQAVARRRRRIPSRFESRGAGHMWLDHLAEVLDLDLRGPDLEAAIAEATTGMDFSQQVIVDPDAPALLYELKYRGFRLGVISNWNADLRKYLEDRALARFFEVILASEEVGSQKPHREIFLKALAAMKCLPQEAIHIGDDYWTDVVGARGVGIRPVLVDRDREGLHRDCTVVRRLKEVEELVL